MDPITDHSDAIFNFPIKDKSNDIIKVIGVGGGGGNAVRNMYSQGITNVSFAICNTDSQALASTDIPVRIQLGEKGLGVGGNPEKGREAAEKSIEDIRKLFDDNTQMVFITAGMGGGTGTGASPVIASVAKEMGILTVGVVTLPFAFEKRKRIKQALLGIEQLKKTVDTLLVINNERLPEIYSDISVTEGFFKADEILTVATKCIAEIITIKGIVNRDFCDVETVMKDGGGAIISMGRASGEHRIMKAMSNALNSPLMSDVEIEKAQRLLYIIYTCDKSPVMINELTEVNTFMDSLDEDLEVLWGLYEDNTLEDDVKVAIIATGFDKQKAVVDEKKDEDKLNRLYETYYNRKPVSPTVADETKHEADSIPDVQEHGEEQPDTNPEIDKENPIEEMPNREEERQAHKGRRTKWLEAIGNMLSSYVNE